MLEIALAANPKIIAIAIGNQKKRLESTTLNVFTMKLLTYIFRVLFGPSLKKLVEDFHVRLLSDWVMQSDGSIIHPRCLWKLASGHPCEGFYEGKDFFDRYVREIDIAYPDWHQVVTEIIGYPIGGIVVGEYQFRRDSSGLWYTAPFTHLYRIDQGKIVGVRYYMGEVRIHLHRSQKLTDLSALYAFHSLN